MSLVEYLALLSTAVVAAFLVRAWLWWSRQPEQFPKPRIRSVAGFVALVSASASAMLWIASVIAVWVRGAFAGIDGVSGGQFLFGLAGLFLSPVARGRTRLNAAILSLAMLLFWFAYIYSRVRGVWL